MHHYPQLIFVFLAEMEFHHVGQAGLELLTSSDQPKNVLYGTFFQTRIENSNILFGYVSLEFFFFP